MRPWPVADARDRRPSNRWENVQQLCWLASGWLRPLDSLILPAAVEWELLFEAASHQLVTPAVAYSLRGQPGVPSQARDYLEGVFYLNGQRNRDVLNAFTDVLRALNTAGIEPVILKGMASLVCHLYPDPAMRISGDIDLLVDEGEGPVAAHLLASLGFKHSVVEGFDYQDFHHLPPQRHPDTGVVVELHRRPLAQKYAALLDARAVKADARSVRLGGCSAFVPSPTHRVVHNIVHNQLSHSSYLKFHLNLRQLLELAALAQRHATEIDWADVRRTFLSNAQRAMFDETLEVTATLFGVSVGSVTPETSRPRRRTLQRESEMSDLMWLLRRFARNSRMDPAMSLRALQPRYWLRTLGAVRRELLRG